jgi:hypothetical protein
LYEPTEQDERRLTPVGLSEICFEPNESSFEQYAMASHMLRMGKGKGKGKGKLFG